MTSTTMTERRNKDEKTLAIFFRQIFRVSTTCYAVFALSNPRVIYTKGVKGYISEGTIGDRPPPPLGPLNFYTSWIQIINQA